MNKINCIGIPYDLNGSYLQGPALAPKLIEDAFKSHSANTFNEQYVDVADLLSFNGNIHINNFEQDIVRSVSEYLESGSKLICLGGDHSITYPIVKSFSKKYNNLSVVVLDAHPDLYADYEGNPYSHASPFARIMEQKLAKHLSQFGIRTATKHQKEQMDKYHVRVVPANKFEENMELSISGPIYLSVDIDVLDPAFAPGVSHHEPGGLTTRQLINFLQNQQHLNIVGADIVEYNPTRDINGVTAMVCAKILKELATIMMK